MGLVVVFLQASFGGWDALPDPVGWGLVLAGLVPLRHVLPSGDVAVWLASLAGLVSLPLVVPAVHERLGASGDWAVGLPQTGCCLLLAVSLGTLAERDGEPGDTKVATRFGLLRTAYVVALVGPAVVYGGHVAALLTPLAVLTVVANVTLVYLVFAVSKRDWAAPAAVVPQESP